MTNQINNSILDPQNPTADQLNVLAGSLGLIARGIDGGSARLREIVNKGGLDPFLSYPTSTKTSCGVT